MKKLIVLFCLLSAFKINAQDFQWVKDLSDYNPNGFTVVDIVVSSTNNVYLLANFTGSIDLIPGPGEYILTSRGGKDLCLAKYTSSGSFAGAFHSGKPSSTTNEEGKDMTIDGNDNIYITGSFQSTYYFWDYYQDTPGDVELTSSCTQNMFVAEFDENLAIQWAKEPYECYEDMDEVKMVGEKIFYQGANDELYIAGHVEGSVSLGASISVTSNDDVYGDIFFTKTAAADAQPFTLGKTLNGSLNNQETVAGIAVHPDNNYIYITGNFYSSATLDLDPSGGVANVTSAGGNDIYISMYSSTGTYYSSSYSGRIGGTSSDEVTSMVMDNAGNIYLSGVQYGGTVDYDFKTGVQNYTSTNNDAWILKLSSLLAYQYLIPFDGVSNQRVEKISIDNNQNICVLGWFYNTTNFNPRGTAYPITMTGTQPNQFFGKYYSSNGQMKLIKTLSSTYGLYQNLILGGGPVSGDIITYGSYLEPIDFDPSTNVGLSTPQTYSNGRYLARYANCEATSISADPNPITICEGQGTTYFCEVDAGTNISYQWQWDGENLVNNGNISGATSSTLFISNVNADMAGSYRCVVNSTCWLQTLSANAALVVNGLPVVNSSPNNTTICEGGNTSFTITATGTALTYKWLVNTGGGYWQPLTNTGVYTGATTATLSITGATSIMNYYQYKCMVSGTCNPSVYSNPALLFVTPTTAVLSQPSNITVCAGNSSSFNVVAAGSNLTYSWQRSTNGGTSYVTISDGTIYGGNINSSTLTITNTLASYNNYLFRCVITGDCGATVYSNAGKVTVNTLPNITSEPVSKTVCENEALSFSVTATGTDVAYQWQVNTGSGFTNLGNNSIYTNVTSATLNILMAYEVMSGYQYRCIVSGYCTPADISATATLTVSPSPDANITAGSTTNFCSGGNVLLSISNTTGYQYQWQRNGVDISAATSNSYTVTESGNYTLAIENSFGCISTSPITIVNVYPVPDASITALGATSFCSGSSVELLVGSGSGYTYQWLKNGSNITNANGASYTATTPGNFYVVVTNTYNCTSYSSAEPVTVYDIPNAIITAASATSFCQGGSVTLNANSDPDYAYQWKKNGLLLSGEIADTYTTSETGQYTVIVTNQNNCSKTATPTQVISNPLPDASMNVIGDTTFCQGNSVQLIASSGSGYVYQWKKNGSDIPGANLSSYIAITSGNYTVNITDANSCQKLSTTKTVTVNTLPIANAGNDQSIANGNIANLTGSGSGGNGSLTYSWTPTEFIAAGSASTIATSDNLTTSRVFSFSVEDQAGCRASDNLTIIITGGPLDVNASATDQSICAGQSVTLNGLASGGTGNYNYSWSSLPIGYSSNSAFPVVSPTSTTTYKVVVNDGYYIDSAEVIITVNALPLAEFTASGPTTFCDGASVILSATTGAGLTYQWNKDGSAMNGANLSSYTATATGNYSVAITNSDGCSASSTNQYVLVNPLPVASASAMSALSFCSGGSVELVSIAGDNYQWQRNSIHLSDSTNQSITASASGNYRVIITDNNGCSNASSPISVTVHALPAAVISTLGATEFCSGNSVQLLVGTGTGYAYQWKKNNTSINGGTMSSQIATTAGDYAVLVTDMNGCTNLSSAETVTVNALPIVNAGIDKGITNGSTTTLHGTASGGTGALSYTWTPDAFIATGESTANATTNHLTSTVVFTLQTVDEKGCSSNDNVTVNVSGGPLDVSASISASSICTGNSVNLNAQASGGTGTYTYAWSSVPAGFTSNAATTSVSPLLNTTYKVVVEDGYYKDSAEVVITVNTAPNVSITPQGSLTFCSGNAVQLDAPTGSGYTYEWKKDGNTINGSNASSFIANTSGQYTVAITSAGYCAAESAPVSVTVNALPNAIIATNESSTFCSGDSALLIANTGAGLSYQWQLNAVNLQDDTLSSVYAKLSGNYKVIITDNNGCVNVSNNMNVTANPIPDASIAFIGDSVFCQGGAVTLAANAGNGATYQWYKNNVIIAGATISTYNAKLSGSYKVAVTDINLCSAESSEKPVSVLALPLVNAGTNQTISNGTTTILSGSASSLNGIASYQWSPSGFINSGVDSTYATTIHLTSSTVFTLQATDSAGCSNSDWLTVNVAGGPLSITLAASQEIVCSGTDIQLIASASGGSGSYIYTWASDPTGLSADSSVAIVTPSANTTYTVTVTDGYYTQTASVSVVVDAAPVATITTSSDTIFCQGGAAVLNANTGSGYTYQWKKDGAIISGASASAYQAKTTGNYSVVVTNQNGCGNESAKKAIKVNTLPAADISTSATEFCIGGSSVLTANYNASYAYQWKKNNIAISDATDSVLTVTSAGNYSVVVTDAHGCTKTSAVEPITVNELPNAIITALGDTEFCAGNSVKLSTNTASGYLYQWKKNNVDITDAIASTLTVSDSGAYAVLITDALNCSAVSTPISTKINANPDVTISTSGSTTICNGDVLTISVPADANAYYNWKWNGIDLNNELTNSIDITKAGQYSVIVSNSLTGCTSQSTKTNVTVNALPAPAIVANGILELCIDDTVKLSTAKAYSAYNWSSGATTTTAAVTTAGTYSVTVSDANGCSNTDDVAVTENTQAAPEICMVSVSPLSGYKYNIIVFDSAQGINIDRFNMYKLDDVANMYKYIGEVKANTKGIFTDSTSTPNKKAEFYKISMVDNCENETAKSNVHKTMLLTTSTGLSGEVNLTWDNYQGLNFSSYTIWRGPDIDHLDSIDHVSNLTFLYKDVDAPKTRPLIYNISINLPEVCRKEDKTKANEKGPYAHSRSNVEDAGVFDNGEGIGEVDLSSSVTLYPNPTSNELIIKNEKLKIKNDLNSSISITNTVGQEVFHSSFLIINSSLKIDVSQFSPGTYFLKLTTDNGVAVKKFVKE